MTEINCSLDNMGSNEPLTVGELFSYSCKGEFNPPDWEVTPQIVGLKDVYALKLIKVQNVDPANLKLVMTSYRVGTHDISEFQINTSTGEYKLKGGLKFEVKSVIDQQSPPEAPYGPFGPLTLSLPESYFWGAGVGLALILSLIALLSYRKWQKNRLIEKLKQFDSAQSPYHQFQAQLRKLQRESPFFVKGQLSDAEARKIIEAMDDFLKLYIIRKYWIPAHDWSPRLILSDLKKRFPGVFQVAADELRVLMREIGKLKKTKQAPQPSDINQLLKKLRILIDKMEAAG